MTNGATTAAVAAGSGAAAAAAAAAANAIKASGAIIRVEPHEFQNILRKMENPVVVSSLGGLFKSFKYLTSYKGFIFYAQSRAPLNLEGDIEFISARNIWVPT